MYDYICIILYHLIMMYQYIYNIIEDNITIYIMDIIQSLLCFFLSPLSRQTNVELGFDPPIFAGLAFDSQVALALLITDAFVLITNTYHDDVFGGGKFS